MRLTTSCASEPNTATATLAIGPLTFVLRDRSFPAALVLKNPFAGIRQNYLRTQAAAYFVELIEICTERDHHEPELFALLRRAFGYLDTNDPNLRAISHFETELARIAGVHDSKKLKADPAFALGNLFGRLPLSRTPLLKTLTSEAKSKAKETA